jgi:hypothetical protein
MSQVTTPPPQFDADLISVIRKTLAQAPEPLSANALCGQLPKPYRKPVDQLKKILTAMVQRREIHEATRYRNSRRFWARDFNEYAKGEIVAAVSQQPLTRSKLKTALKVKGVNEELRRLLIKELLSAGQVYELPAITGRSKMLSSGPCDPRPYVERAVNRFVKGELKKLAEKLKKVNIPPTELAAVAATLLTQMSEDDAQPNSAPSPSSTSGETSTTAAPTLPQQSPSNDRRDVLLKAMGEIEPRAPQGAMVGVPELRQRLAEAFPTGTDFDALVWELVGQQVLAVHRHGSAMTEPDGLRQQYLQDDHGNFFHTVSVRVVS